MALDVIRKLIMCCQNEKIAKLSVTVEEEVASYLNNRKRRELMNLEDEHELQVLVLSREDVSPEYVKIECEDGSGRTIRAPEG